MRILAGIAAAGLVLSVLATSAADTVRPAISVPVPDAERGRMLFATKGCVVCHSVNGVGGTYAPKLDTANAQVVIRPLAFAARMWRGAEAMLALQAMEFGYQIELSDVDLADLAAFAADPVLQSQFSVSDIPDVMRGWSINAIEALEDGDMLEEGDPSVSKDD